MQKKKMDVPQEPERVDLPVFEADPESGLSREQVETRRKSGWANVDVKSPTKTEKEIIRAHTLTFST